MAIPQSSIIALSLMYTKLPPSASDLTYWASPAGQAVSWEQAVQAFSTSSAAKAAYPMLASPTVLSQNAAARRDYVTQAFQNLYGIAAADIPAAELTYWADTYLVSSPQAIFDFPVVLNQYSPAARQQALTNRAQVAENFAVAMAADGSSTFTSAQYSSGWVIVNTVTADAASVTAANAQIAQFIAGGGGGTGTTFTLLEQGAVLTASASSKVAPAGQFLNSSNNTVEALTFLPNSFVQDPSTADADVLTAQILGVGLVTPNITNIETIEFTGSTGAEVNIVNISGVKSFVIKSGNLQVNTAEKFPLNLAAGYASTLTVNTSAAGKDLTVNLAGTSSGTKIVDASPVAPANPITGKLTLNVNADSTISELTYDDDNIAPITANVVITGSKNLTINGILDLSNGALLDGTDFKGKLSLTTNDNTSNNPSIAIVGGQSDDTFNFTTFGAGTLTNATTLTGNGGVDTVTVKGTAFNAFDKVTDIDKIVIAAGANSAITANASLISSVGILEVDASALAAANFLNFNGVAGPTSSSLKITGGAGADNLTGGAGKDTLIGGAGNDALVGGVGDNLLQGDAGLNNLTGGTGKDQFVLNQSTDGNLATIVDFTVADDKLALSNAAFAGAPAVGATMVISNATGPANLATTLVIDTGAALLGVNRSNIRFGIANAGGGGLLANHLYYDADGNFSTGAIAIANIGTSALTSTNFSIIA
jgi:Ca2+-binding RTX toxin-like protein